MVLKALLVGAALTFTISVWLYAYLIPGVNPKVERALSILCVVSCLALSAIATIIALAHV